MRRSRRTGWVVAVVTVTVVALSGSAQAAPPDIRAGELKRGADARILFADGTVLHTRASGEVAMPPSDHGPTETMRLLGKTPSGWLVWHRDFESPPSAYHHTLTEVTLDHDPSVVHERVVPAEEYIDLAQWYGLSEDGLRIVEWLADEGSGGLTVRNLSGDVVGRSKGYFATRILDFSGPRLAYLQDSRAYVWRIGHQRRLVTDRTASFADLQGDVVFLQTPDGRFGPTRLSRPGPVAWKAPFEAMRLSPDGTLVIGQASGSHSGRPVFQVRRMSDGAVVTSFRAGNPRQDLVWEGNRAVLFPGYRADGKVAVVRCTLAATCTRASGWIQSADGLSFPSTPQD